MSSSRVFKGHRAVGLVSNHVPLIIRYVFKRNEHMIVTCVGKSFHTYGSNHLKLLSVSERHESDIELLAADRQFVYTVVGSTVRAWKRGTDLIHTYVHAHNIHTVLPFGPHLVTIDIESTMKVWDINSEEVYAEIEFSNKNFQITCILHPSTYLNKVLLGSKQGSLQLWNLMKSSLVYSFTGWDSAVLTAVQAPAVDTVAIGLENGNIILHNLKYDESLMTFSQEWGPATTISFRSDGPAIMLSGSPQGHIALWDLEEQKLAGQMWQAHQSAVSGMCALPSNPLMVTSSPDNTLKMWIFDMPDGSGRLLRMRGGHSAPPTYARFYGNDGHILSAAQDSSIRAFSSENDKVNRSFGYASYNRKLSKKKRLGAQDTLIMPPIVSFSAVSIREKEWDNIVAIHHGLPQVTTWSFDKQRMGEHQLLHERFKKQSKKTSVCTCCDLSTCGNYVITGYTTGHVDKFNIQSGIWRGSIGEIAHAGAVRGVASTALVRQVLTVGGDGFLRFWNFKSGACLAELKLDALPAQLVLDLQSGLAAIALDDYSVIVVDASMRNIVRRFTGHQSSIMDICISPDANWLLTSSLDCCINVWSLPQGALVDVLKTNEPATSLSMDPSGRMLLTTHIDQLGVYLWSNVTLYEYVSLPPLPSDYSPASCNMPSTVPEVGKLITVEDVAEESFVVDNKDDLVSAEQIADQLVTLSLLPESRWAHLLTLDAIRRRNKPKDSVKSSTVAPFFLPSVPGLNSNKFALPEANTGDSEYSKVQHMDILFSISDLGKLLLQTEADEVKCHAAILSLIMSFSPVELETELRQLRPGSDGSCKLSKLFLMFVMHQLETGRNFEFLQASLGLFMKLHGSAIIESEELRSLLPSLRDRQNEAWQTIQTQIDSSLCLIGFLKSSTIS